MTFRQAIDRRAAQIGGWRMASVRLTALVFFLPFLMIGSEYGFLWGVLFIATTGWASLVALDALYFGHQIRCPKCDASLWRCLENGPRGRRLTLREEAAECPRCGVAFSNSLENHGARWFSDPDDA